MTLPESVSGAALATAIVGLAAAAAASGAVWFWLLLSGAGRWFARPRGYRDGLRTGLPWWLRMLLPFAEPLARRLGPHLPLGARKALHAALRRAGVDEDLQPQQIAALALLLAVASGLVAVLAPGGAVSVAIIVLAVAVQAAPWLWLRDAARRREREVQRDLPFYLDVLVLALESGGTLSVALRAATERAPDSALRRAFERVLVDIRTGRGRAEALRALAERMDVAALVPLVAALVQADASGSSLAAVLRAQADQRLAERFTAAERRALEAPVKMLGPLVLCIFPCTFLVLAFPLVMRFVDG
jgi:tight adherence protein C